MRFWAVSLLVSFTSLLLCLEAKAAEVIHSFDVVAKANKDASLDITEKIAYDFGTRYRHGILRNIPVAYSRYGAAYTIDLRLVDVKDESGNQLPVKVARNGRDIDIRIGDPDVTVTGQHVYNIHYILRRALNFFEGAPEFYWNVTGSQSPVPIEHATFMLYPPPGCSANQVRVQSYHGRVGSSQEHAQMRVEAPAIMYSCYDIQPGQDFTVVAGFPKG